MSKISLYNSRELSTRVVEVVSPRSIKSMTEEISQNGFSDIKRNEYYDLVKEQGEKERGEKERGEKEQGEKEQGDTR